MFIQLFTIIAIIGSLAGKPIVIKNISGEIIIIIKNKI
jgi:hypothetical protein